MSEECGKRGVSSDRFRIARSTRGSVEEDDWMWRARVRLRALMTAGSGTMAVSALSEEVSTWL